MSAKVQLFEMTRPEVESAMANGFDTAVATFGSTEQHGLHLPQGTDAMWGEGIGHRVTKALGNALQVPGVRIGRSEHHMAFPGSLTYSEETFNSIVRDICTSMAHHGFQRIVLLPTHGGNFAPLGAAAKLVQPDLPAVKIMAYSELFPFVEKLYEVAARFGFSPEHTGAHAGENETSMILALRPELVHMDKAEAGFLGDPIKAVGVLYEHGFKAVSENGVLGNPAGATAEIGEAYLKAISDFFVDFVKSNSA